MPKCLVCLIALLLILRLTADPVAASGSAHPRVHSATRLTEKSVFESQALNLLGTSYPRPRGMNASVTVDQNRRIIGGLEALGLRWGGTGFPGYEASGMIDGPKNDSSVAPLPQRVRSLLLGILVRNDPLRRVEFLESQLEHIDWRQRIGFFQSLFWLSDWENVYGLMEDVFLPQSDEALDVQEHLLMSMLTDLTGRSLLVFSELLRQLPVQAVDQIAGFLSVKVGHFGLDQALLRAQAGSRVRAIMMDQNVSLERRHAESAQIYDALELYFLTDGNEELRAMADIPRALSVLHELTAKRLRKEDVSANAGNAAGQMYQKGVAALDQRLASLQGESAIERSVLLEHVVDLDQTYAGFLAHVPGADPAPYRRRVDERKAELARIKADMLKKLKISGDDEGMRGSFPGSKLIMQSGLDIRSGGDDRLLITSGGAGRAPVDIRNQLDAPRDIPGAALAILGAMGLGTLIHSGRRFHRNPRPRDGAPVFLNRPLRSAA
ncbi:MAG: hypothetical protein A2992_04490 [Elusimicrobia bacterium RIFCSPLOWO2_01_FULL_59_12]|nr:MAG: hypothetical protein A2992_04490 [Elusimicrobia bacterium RIFCSPLOWO2_01_FULL_59_12]